MKTIDLGKSGLTVSAVALGCMRIAELADDKLEKLIFTALETGINFFDHADIYGGGNCETRFGKLLVVTYFIARASLPIAPNCSRRATADSSFDAFTLFTLIRAKYSSARLK